MKPELEQKIYQGILRKVNWGAEREEILHILEVNGIKGEEAEAFFLRAKNERIQLIRSEAMRKAFWGMGILLAALGVLVGFWLGLGGITRAVFVICVVGFSWGVWWLIDGVVTALMAASRKGSIC